MEKAKRHSDSSRRWLPIFTPIFLHNDRQGTMLHDAFTHRLAITSGIQRKSKNFRPTLAAPLHKHLSVCLARGRYDTWTK
jgi:hypothetical protein